MEKPRLLYMYAIPVENLLAGLLIVTMALGVACGNMSSEELAQNPVVNQPNVINTPEAPAPPSDAEQRSHVISRSFQAIEGGSEFLQTDSVLITVRPGDTIPAILDPIFVSREVADAWMDDSELVLGLEIGGDARAYPINVLGWHEIVNDTVGGAPVAVTW